MSEETAHEIIWTHEKCKQLALALEQNSCLWDRTNDNYKRNTAKLEARKSIAERMGVDVTLIDSKIKSITAQFYREIRKQKSQKKGVGSGQEYKSKWFLLPHLTFLEHSQNTTRNRSFRNSTTLAEHFCIEETDGRENYPEVEFIDTKENNITAQFNRLSKNDYSVDDALSTDEENERLSIHNSFKKFPNCKAKDLEVARALASLANNLASKPTNRNGDEWDIFGSLVAQKIRNLKNGGLKLKAESQIHSLLMQIQAEDNGCTFMLVSND